MSDTIKVTLAYPFTDSDEKTHKADATVSLPREVGKNLIHSGRARYPETTKPAKKASAPRKRAAKKAAASPATPEKES